MKKSYLAKNLKKKREQLEWTRTQAALKLSISYSRYKNIELSRTEPTGKELLHITEVFAIDDLYLFMSKTV